LIYIEEPAEEAVTIPCCVKEFSTLVFIADVEMSKLASKMAGM
jgi:hypothetical protein